MTRLLVFIVCFVLVPAASATADPWTLADRSKVAVVDDPRFVVAPCPEQDAMLIPAGCTWMTDDALIYIRPEYANDWFTVYHELGHRFDHDAMSTILRRAFVRARGARWRSWTSEWEERFADSYALCARNPRRIPANAVPPGYGHRVHEMLCGLIDEAGVRAGLV